MAHVNFIKIVFFVNYFYYVKQVACEFLIKVVIKCEKALTPFGEKK